MNTDLPGGLDAVSRAPVLLVATDFDGAIAPIVSDPLRAEADREAMVALKSLAATPQTHVAVISGRSLSDLAGRAQDLGGAHLVGSHGSEFEPGVSTALKPDARALLDRLTAFLRELTNRSAGLTLEEKPAALALHYRNATDSTAEGALAAVLQGPAQWLGVHLRHGKKVIELSVVETNKGAALRRLRQRLGATAVVFIGDDATDEDAFELLSGPDVGIKVGLGETRARHRVDDTIEVSRLLARLAERRAEWSAGAEATPIERHSLLSDQRTVALVDPRGRVVWMCLPRLDSAAVFAELLGGPTAGGFEVRPASATEAPRQEYIADTCVLLTQWPQLSVTDYLDCGGARAFQRAGRTDLIRVVEGRGGVRVVFAPRLDFGRMETRLRLSADGVEVEGSLDPLVLRGPGLPWRLVEEGPHQSAVADFEMGADPVVLEMRYGTGNLRPDPMPEPERRRRTVQFWSSWVRTLSPPLVARSAVLRSALVLKALTFGPTGSIAAAATTSLPEHAGGVRNWDYRFCWPRDAAMSAAALARLGATGPAIKFLDWVLGILDDCEPGSMLCPLYTVTGGHLGPEGEIAELGGYRGSRPVRVGNSAAHQIQLDVFGPIAELVALLAEHGVPLSSEHWRMLDAMVSAVERRWREPDHGIWEVRRPRQHHVHSKVMCWRAVDRALAVAAYLGRSRPDWSELREHIAADVLARGWNADRGTFCATYDDHEPDASTLAVGLCGLLSPDDSRYRGTVDYVERHLRAGPTVYRYRYDDGLPGMEGGFHLCTTWLIEAYAQVGRLAAARELFDEYLNLAGPTGLFAEQFDPVERRALGNFPQAYSHLGLINAAVRLDGQSVV